MKKLIPVFLSLFSISQQIVVLPGCANIIPPQGGPKDTLPPRLIKASPPDSSRHFSANKIVFTFDEFLDRLDNIQQNLLVSPVPKNNPEVDSKFRAITVKLKDTLEPNTTYSLNFGNAIKDINEGNVLKNFTYVFTTGSSLDSLSFAGNVLLAETGKPDTTLIVMLYKNSDDSAVVKEKPRYITRLDNQGNFIFRNLPGGNFYIYALKDESGTHRYLSVKSLFAFADKPVIVSQNTEPITLYAYQEIQTPSVLLQQPSTNKNADKRLKFQTNLENGQMDLLNDFGIVFEKPLKIFDTTKIHFSSDSTFSYVAGYRINLDSTKRKITIQLSWKENKRYNVILEKDFATDSFGRKLLKSDTISFKTKKLSDYGSLRIRFKNLDLSKNPVLQFVQNNSVVRSVVLTSAEIHISVFFPGEYDLRILFDRNKNGKWDAGEFFGKHRQPEIVKPVDRHIIVKASWENEFDIAL
jgi:hypothetical protein